MKTDFDVCVIGAGAAGLTVAGGAALFGLRTCLIEAGAMGGDCLNTGCVPSKALLSNAHLAHQIRISSGLIPCAAGDLSATSDLASLTPDFRAVMDKVTDAISKIAPHDSVERFEDMGCTVIKGHASFTDAKTITVNDQQITARHFVLATGSSPNIPEGLGLDDIVAFTTENIWMLRECPDHLLVLGGGAVGVELGQAFARLGADVSILEKNTLLPREDSDAVQVVRQQLEEDGITLFEETDVMALGPSGGRVLARVRSQGGVEAAIKSDAVLVAAGRRPNVKGLGLDRAGVKVGDKGIHVTDGIRTTNPRVFVVGDATGAPYATNMSGHEAVTLLKRLLFKLPVKARPHTVPRVLYSAPQLAQVGLTQAEAEARFGSAVKTISMPFDDNDRAIAEGRTEGFAKVILSPRNKVLGCTMVGERVDDLIAPWTLAVSGKISLSDLSAMIYPYPTRSEITKALADKALEARTFSPFLKNLAKLLMRL